MHAPETLEQIDTRLRRLALPTDTPGGEQSLILKIHADAADIDIVNVIKILVKYKLVDYTFFRLRPEALQK